MDLPPPNFFNTVFPEKFWVLWVGQWLNRLPQTTHSGRDCWLVFASEDDANFFGDNILPYGRFETEEMTLDRAREVFEPPNWLVIWDRLGRPTFPVDPRPIWEIPIPVTIKYTSG